MKSTARCGSTSSIRLGDAIIIGLTILSCNKPFEPRAPLDAKLVVFSILSTDRIDQCVRVERTYMPDGYDASTHTIDGFVNDASVELRGPNAVHVLRETTIVRTDTARYRFPIRLYAGNPLIVTHGTSYQIAVRTLQFPEAVASVTLPARPTLEMSPLSILVLQHPFEYKDNTEILFTIDLGLQARGWIGRLYICYDVLKDGKWISERTEVPFYFVRPAPTTSVVYGELLPAGYNNRCASLYLNKSYVETFESVIYEKHPQHRIVFTRALFELVQTEENLYNYFMVAHGNKDPFSVRLDEPVYTNLNGGLGVVGGYTLDSLVQALPANFVFNRY